jgi:hypothetical protein
MAPPPPLPPVAAGVDRQNEFVLLHDGYPLVLPPGLTDDAEETNAIGMNGAIMIIEGHFVVSLIEMEQESIPRQVMEHQLEGVVDEGEEEYPVQQLLLLLRGGRLEGEIIQIQKCLK